MMDDYDNMIYSMITTDTTTDGTGNLSWQAGGGSCTVTSTNGTWGIADSWTTPSIKLPQDFYDLQEKIKKIEERLAIITPNLMLEEKWAALKELGDQYRALEKDITEKELIIDILKK